MNFPLAMPNKPVILASASPRRAELLRKIGLDFEVHPSHIDEEDGVYHLHPAEMVVELARRKALAVADRYDSALVIGADTTVVLEGVVLGKPATPEEAAAMLARLAGRTHEVYTGFAIVDRPTGRLARGVEKTEVTFRPLRPEEIAAYVASGAPMDKAGAYGIQDFSAVFVERIAGCFYNVVGFPLTRFYRTLQEFCESLAQVTA
ncbi:MAG: Maf family protein [candidate division KSB1 bacterium]|nr:Maf family protein [candidate division KSB1 bacterium]MDZ7288164.1 Maf family protein [candidate division KSB1 bacterium]MDZ7300323.1 Maf family protein [candidate division KSB1 bacterium]MDZ7308671.1 Maf family protein [candidate division KSB1 bacterium]MDZ7351323.1 Maf family protein [candidate division KSB1 bacterium]